MTPGLGPFRSREEANQPTDWQKHANRVALKYSCCCALFLTLTFAAGTVFWIAADFFTGVWWVLAFVLPDYDHCLNSNKVRKVEKRHRNCAGRTRRNKRLCRRSADVPRRSP